MRIKGFELLGAQDPRDQQDQVGPCRMGKVDLDGVDDEVFTENRQVRHLRHLGQKLKAPPEVGAVGYYAYGRSVS